MHSRAASASRRNEEEWRSDTLHDEPSQISTSGRRSRGSFEPSTTYADEGSSRKEKSSGFFAACCPCLRRKKDKELDDREEDVELSEMRSSRMVADSRSLRTTDDELRSESNRDTEGKGHALYDPFV